MGRAFGYLPSRIGSKFLTLRNIVSVYEIKDPSVILFRIVFCSRVPVGLSTMIKTSESDLVNL